MKRTLYLVLVLALVFQLCACGSPAPADSSAPGDADAAAVIPEEQQRKLIDDRMDVWALDAGEYAPWYHTVTDLDHNGRLEVITATLEGTGLYTYANYWEVNEEGTGLVRLTTDFKEGDSWPDIITDKATCCLDTGTGRYWYIFEDIMRNGAAEHYNTMYGVCLHDGTVERMTLGSRFETYVDGEAKVECFDAQGKAASEADYTACVKLFSEGKETTTASFDWTEEDLPQEPMLIFASDLYDGYGYVHARCDRTGVYDFAPISSEGVTWEVYILDQEFNDAERFIPQAYPCALKGSGSLSIKEGEWIYIYCPCNTWTTDTAPEGCAYSWGINPDRQYGDAPRPGENNTEETDIVITKNPSGESIASGGKTWFIAYADNADRAIWYFTDTAGKEHSLDETMQLNPGLKAEALDMTTLAVSNVPSSLNGWSVLVRYENDHSRAVTSPATIYVQDFPDAYNGILASYRSAIESGERSYQYAADHGISEYYAMADHVGFALKDLDKNGTAELIIAGVGPNDNTDMAVYAIYTLNSGKAVKLCESLARARYYLLSDSRILFEGSSGAAYSTFDLYKVNGKAIEFIEGFSTYDNVSDADGSTVYLTYVLGGDGYPDRSHWDSSMSFDDGMSIVAGIRAGKWLPDLTRFA